MTDAGFFKGTSAEQDARFADKKKKLMKTMKFGDNLSQKVDMTRINLESIRPWIVKRITELLNFEDELVCDYLFNQLEERHPDPKEIQINMTGFLNSKNARIFLSELWDLLLSAMETPDGVPAVFLEAKKEEILKRQEEEKLVQSDLLRKECQFREKSTNMKPITPAAIPQTQARIPPDSHDLPVAKKVIRRRSSTTSSSPSPRPRRRSTSKSNSDKNVDRSSRSPEPRNRRLNELKPNEEPEPHMASKHRSPSRDDVELPPVKRTPESDWRRDLMQGRRRSPPQMPENSYYGYEKRSKEKRHSRERDRARDRRREHDTPESRRYRSHHRSSSRDRRHEYKRRDSHNAPDPAGDSRYRHHVSSRLPEPEISDRRRSRKHEERHRSRSKSSGRHEHASKIRHSQRSWAGDEPSIKHVHEYGRAERRSNQDEENMYRKQAYNRNQSPEGPLLPSSLTKHSRNKPHEEVPRKRPKRQSSTSSESSESSSSSGSSGSSSGDSSSSEGGSSGNADASPNVPKKLIGKKPAVHAPEGPSLPPELEIREEPEGPSLPPALNQSQISPDKSNGAGASESSSSSSSESEDEQSDHSGSSSSGSSGSSSSSTSGSSSSSESEEDTKQKHHKMKSKMHIRNGGERRVASPEGPTLPPSDSHRRKHSRNHDSMEEALRQRALASLMVGSEKRRTASRSP